MELGTERIRKLLVQYAVPAIIAMTASSLYNMVDSIFIGHGVGGAGHFGAGPDVPADEPRGGVRFVGGWAPRRWCRCAWGSGITKRPSGF